MSMHINLMFENTCVYSNALDPVVVFRLLKTLCDLASAM
jgi:hypothetical protein